MNVVGIKDLHISCIIGCLEEERKAPQELLIDFSLHLPIPSQDLLSETVDYTKVAELIDNTAKSGCYFLLETLALRIAKNILQNFLQVTKVEIIIKKQNALKTAAYSFVELKYGRQ